MTDTSAFLTMTQTSVLLIFGFRPIGFLDGLSSANDIFSPSGLRPIRLFLEIGIIHENKCFLDLILQRNFKYERCHRVYRSHLRSENLTSVIFSLVFLISGLQFLKLPGDYRD
jgi:hypothetical protein